MASKTVRLVNVVPISKLKKVSLPEDDDDCVSCSICSKSFASEMALKNHAKIEHIEELQAGVNICVKGLKKPDQNNEGKGKKTKTEEDYCVKEDVLETTDGERKSKKRKTDKTIKMGPKKAKQTQNITGPFECMQPSASGSGQPCHQLFFTCCEYSAHYRDDHTRRRKGNKCQVCEKPLVAAGEVEAPYPCLVCGSGFNSAKELSEHTSSEHVRLKPYECSVCRKRFTQLGGLQQHTRAHTGDRPFKCTHCPKAFTQKSGLDQHLRIHTKDKPYKCILCGKAFCQSVHLQQHMRTHTNVTPFQCLVCDKRFKQSSHLNYHLKYHNPSQMDDDQKAKYFSYMRVIGKQSIFEEEQQDTQVTDDQPSEEEKVIVENEVICPEIVFLDESSDNNTFIVPDGWHVTT